MTCLYARWRHLAIAIRRPSFTEHYPPKLSIWGRESAFFKLNSLNINTCVLYCIDYNEILYIDKDHQILFVSGPNMLLEIQDGGRPPF